MKELFRQIFNSELEHTYKAPARINLIGEHIDYNGGKVFPCAIDKYIYAYVSFRDDTEIHLFSKGKDLKVGNLNKLEFDENDAILSIKNIKFDDIDYPENFEY